MENGTPHPPLKAALRAHAAIPGIWRLPTIRNRTRRDLTLRSIKEPAFMRLKGTETRPLALAGSGPMLVLLCSLSTAFDIMDTIWRSRRPLFTRPVFTRPLLTHRSITRPGVAAVRAPDAPGEDPITVTDRALRYG